MTEAQRKVPSGGLAGERVARRWLRRHGFNIIESFRKPHAGYYDIKAKKDGYTWLIEVKTQVSKGRPPVSIDNLIKMLESEGVQKVGLLFISKSRGSIPLLFELNRISYAALKAWRKRKSG